MKNQQGTSLLNVILWLVVLAFIGIIAFKVTPSVIEYRAIKAAIERTKAHAESTDTVQSLEDAFDRQAQIGYITTITGKNLEIAKEGGDIDIGFDYEKRIHLFWNVSLVIHYSGSTDNQ